MKLECKWLLAFCFVILMQSINAQEDSVQVSKINYNVLPIAFYLPETGFALGGTGIMTFRFDGESVESRPSQVLVSAAYTLKNQLLFFAPFDVYRNDENSRIKGEIGYYRYFYNFYGIGPSSSIEDKEIYNVNFPRIQAIYYHRIWNNNFLGAGYRFDYFDITDVAEGGILDNENILGKEGGTISNLMFAAIHDSRDHIFDTKRGWMIEAIAELGISAIGADFEYWKYAIDLRKFIPLSREITLASQAYISQVDAEAPFFVYPYISTPQYGRGYADRRFIDRSMASLQSEIRFPISGRFAGVAFASGSLFGDSFSTLGDGDVKLAGGIGGRFILNKKERTKIRLDLAFTIEGLNFYITANDAF